MSAKQTRTREGKKDTEGKKTLEETRKEEKRHVRAFVRIPVDITVFDRDLVQQRQYIN